MTDKQPRFITKGEIVTAGQAERIARSLGEQPNAHHSHDPDE